MYQARISMTDFQENIKNAGDNVENIMKIFSTDSSTKEYFSTLASEADKYAAALKVVEDQSQRVALLSAYGKEKAGDLSSKQIENFSTGFFDDETLKNQGFDDTTSNIMRQHADEITTAMIQSAIDEVNRNPELSPEEKETILSSVD